MIRWRRISPDRANLAAQQAELLSALLDHGSPPAGFDSDRLHAQSAALRAKRRRVLSALRPELHELGDRLPALFEEYARGHPRRTGTTAREDATAFVEWLRKRRALPRPKFWHWQRFRRWVQS